MPSSIVRARRIVLCLTALPFLVAPISTEATACITQCRKRGRCLGGGLSTLDIPLLPGRPLLKGTPPRREARPGTRREAILLDDRLDKCPVLAVLFHSGKEGGVFFRGPVPVAPVRWVLEER